MTTLATRRKTERQSKNDRRQSGENLYRALDYLRFKAANVNAGTACETIARILSEQKYYRLFKSYFPDQWRKSRSSFYKRGYYEAYSERINEFFKLVNEHLFPVLETWEDPEAEFDFFYVYSLNIDLCCEEIDFEYLRISYLAALLIFNRDEDLWEYFLKNHKIRRDELPEIHAAFHEDLWSLERSGAVKIYLQLFELVDHSTGNPWLDTTNCQYGACYEWTEEVVDYLTTHFREANAVFDLMDELDQKITENPQQVLTELITLWNEARLPEK